MADSQEKGFNIFIANEVFPDAAAIFLASFKPLEEVKDTALVVIDTNALLVPYNVGKNSLEQIGTTYRNLVAERRLIIPGQVAREFAKHRPLKIAELFQRLSRKRSSLQEIKIGKYPLLEGVPAYQEILQLEQKVNDTLRDYRKAIGKLLEHIQSWEWNDPVSLLYKEIFTEEVVWDIEFDHDEMAKELERRNLHKIPPGYKDAAKKDAGIGDLLIWRTILEVGQKRQTNVIFVSGDVKSDWWYVSEEQALYPRYELVDEFRRVSQGASFHIVTFSRFLDLYGASKDAVEEVRLYEEERKQFYALIGEFLQKWQQLEHSIRAFHRDKYPNVPESQLRSIYRIVRQWQKDEVMAKEFVWQIAELNEFRNQLMHEHMNFSGVEIRKRIQQIENLIETLWSDSVKA